MNDLEHFWTAPMGETILGLVNYQGMIVVATNRTVYVIKDQGRGLFDYEIAAISIKGGVCPKCFAAT